MKPTPAPDDVTAFYWRGAAEGELLVLRCAACGYLSHPPDVSCARCGAVALDPVEMSGLGSVYSFAIVRQTYDPAFLPEVPYVVALVELDEQPGLLLLANIVEIEPELVEIGMRVEVTFEHRGDDAVPQFRPSEHAGATS
ncbi:MAG: Zn-ribbon domain-containing OB-fold protein [Acidimicrobiia bacterium]